ncbi:hypothetical protein J5J86_21620 [Aquabacter sp. L1I39]|uniref:hypothetical protein n=1 Tax=Aquabacter sp. L1I39 TaxID=2820278 RepID=UPI001AD9FC22|nr:hypothetical protein [Aquabacter sp. L1I39]QTL03310.1 hypothetical protein J5J86_21620 [Aquabacter sp. L1I39]
MPARAVIRPLASGLACALLLGGPVAALPAHAASSPQTAQTTTAPVPLPPAAPAAPGAAPKSSTPTVKTEPPVPAGPAAGVKETDLALACKDRALTILKQRSPSIEDIFIDMDGLTIAEADLAVGNTKIRNVLMGEAYIQRDRSDKVHRFLCLTGEGDTVLLTFLTER